MAEVYLAQQQGMAGFEKLVVIKRILPQLKEDSQFVQMLLSEARIAAGLRHPNIVETYDVRRDESEFYLVMEYLSGEDLRFILTTARKEGFQIPVGVAGRIVADAAAGLNYAHRASDPDGGPLGIVHRDIGPTNLILTYHGVTKVVDFGVAKANIHNIYTRPGVLKGKYAYCSPEQAQHRELDARSDIFSLGIVLHELLTGRRLFRGKNPPEVLKSVMEMPVPEPSRLNPSVPPEVDRVVMAALERNRSHRIPSTGELQETLEYALDKHGLLLSAHQVSGWMATVLPEARDIRQRLESEVERDVGGSGVTDGTQSHDRGPGTLAPPPIPEFASNASPVVGTSGSVDPRMLHSQSNQHSQSQQHQGQWSHASQMSHASQVSMVGLQEPARKTGLVVVLSVVGTLLLVVLLGLAFYLGIKDRETNEVTTATLQTPEPATIQKVALLVHVVPEGTQITVNGKTRDQVVGVDGMLVPLDANQEAILELSKKGYKSVKRTVMGPARGTENMYFTLQRAGTVAPAPTAPVAVAPTPNPVRSVPAARPTSRRINRPSPRRSTSSPRPTQGRLTVTHTPADAKVYIDNKLQAGTSPHSIGNLSAGAHKLKVTAKGFSDAEQIALIEAGRTTTTQINLAPKAATRARIDIVTSPAGASVKVDGRPRGRSPVVGLQLSPDTAHEVSITLEGHKPWSTQIQPASGANPPVVATLQPLATATAPLAARPNKGRDITVPRSMTGDADQGRDLFNSKCKSCHGNSTARVRTTRYTGAQWNRYFARARHARHGALRDNFTLNELADVKSYLVSTGADVDSDHAAGVR